MQTVNLQARERSQLPQNAVQNTEVEVIIISLRNSIVDHHHYHRKLHFSIRAMQSLSCVYVCACVLLLACVHIV